jgi:hypothetical protein
VNTPSLANDIVRVGPSANKIRNAGLGVGIALLAIALVLLASHTIDAWRFWRGYIAAFEFVLAISLGGLIFTMIQHATRAGWSVLVRRMMEVLASNLLWIWILFIPIAVAMTQTNVYEWAVEDIVASDPILQGKEAFLNKGFWLLRAAIYFGLWAFLARYFLVNSVAQDENGDVEHTHRMQRLAPLGILVFAVTCSLAGIDWVMSLEPHWFSTMFGVYIFACAACACFATIILMIFLLQRAGYLKTSVTLEHYQDLGKFLFAFGVVFWAYIAFSQFMLIWYANIPEETTFFVIRSVGGWWSISLLLLIGHFIVPFLAILSKHVKRAKPVIAAAAVWMLFMVIVDFYWLCVPKVPTELLHEMNPFAGTTHATFVHEFETRPVSAEELHHLGIHDTERQATYQETFGFNPKITDVLLIVGMIGIFIGGTVHRLSRHSLVPRQDPRISESLAFENM